MTKVGGRRPVRRAHLDMVNMVLTLGKERYMPNILAPAVQAYLLLLGLKTALLMRDNTATAYRDLLAGHIPEQRSLMPLRRSKWRQVIAYALAATKVTASAPKGTKKDVVQQMIQVELPAMEDHAHTLPKELVRKLSERADVQEHYRRMFGVKPGDMHTSLLALAGLDEALTAAAGVDVPAEQAAA